MRIATALVSATVGSVLGVHLVSCGSFGATSVEAPEGSIDPDAAGATDAPADTFARSEGGGCAPSVVVDFNSGGLPPSGFEVQKSSIGATIAQTATDGVGGSGALVVDLVTPPAGEGHYAHITRNFDIAAPAEVALSFDFTSPTTDLLYSTLGCALSFRSVADAPRRTDLGAFNRGAAGPQVLASSQPNQGNAMTGALEPGSAAFHHLELRVVVATGGKTARAHYKMGSNEGDLDFPLIDPPASLALTCGFYADNAAATPRSVIDNVRFGICAAQ